MTLFNGVDATEFVLAHRVDFVLRGDGPMLVPLVVLLTDVVVDGFVSLFFPDMVDINKMRMKILMDSQ